MPNFGRIMPNPGRVMPVPVYYPPAQPKAKSRRGKSFRDLISPDPYAAKLLKTKGLLQNLDNHGISNLHGSRLALAGVMFKLGAPKTLALSVMRSGLGYVDDAEKCVDSTYKRGKEGLALSGGMALKSIIGRRAYENLLKAIAEDLDQSELEVRRVLLFGDNFPIEESREFFRRVVPILKEKGFDEKGLARLSGLASCRLYNSKYVESGDVIWCSKKRCGRKNCLDCRRVYWEIAEKIMEKRLEHASKVKVARVPVKADDLISVRAKAWRATTSSEVVAYTDFLAENLVFVGDVEPIAEDFGVEVELYSPRDFIDEVFSNQVYSLADRLRDHILLPDFIDRIMADPWLAGQTHTYTRRHGSTFPLIPPSEDEVREIIKARAIDARQGAGVFTILDLCPEAEQELDEDGRFSFEFEHSNSVTGRFICSTAKPIPPWEIRQEEMKSLERVLPFKVKSREKTPKLE